MFQFICNHLDTKYNKLKNLKDKKTHLKELIRGSESCKKGMLVKFINNTYYLKGFDEYKQCFCKSYPDHYDFDDSDLDDDFCYRNDGMPVNDVFKNLFYQYIKHNASGYNKYFDYVEVIKWAHRIF